MTPAITFEPIHSAPIEDVQVCMRATDYVDFRVRSATVAAQSDHDVESLLHQLGEREDQRNEAREERDNARTWLTWTGVALVIAIGLGIVGAVAR